MIFVGEENRIRDGIDDAEQHLAPAVIAGWNLVRGALIPQPRERPAERLDEPVQVAQHHRRRWPGEEHPHLRVWSLGLRQRCRDQGACAERAQLAVGPRGIGLHHALHAHQAWLGFPQRRDQRMLRLREIDLECAPLRRRDTIARCDGEAPGAGFGEQADHPLRPRRLPQPIDGVLGALPDLVAQKKQLSKVQPRGCAGAPAAVCECKRPDRHSSGPAARR